MGDATKPQGHMPNANDLAQRRTDLATERTLMAASRTLMAWVRTGIAQISFGFALYKVLDQLVADGKLADRHRIVTPAMAGIILLVMGIMAIVVGITEYEGSCRKLGVRRQWQPLITAGAFGLVGAALLVAILFGQ